MSRAGIRSACLAVVMAVAACGGDDRSGGTAGDGAHERSVPELQRVMIGGGVDTLFWSEATSLALMSDGRFVVLSDAGLAEGMLLHFVEPLTGLIRYGGRRGEGPGELAGAGSGGTGALSGEHSVHVLNHARLVMMEFDGTGVLLGETPIPDASTMALAVGHDSLDLTRLVWIPGQSAPLIARIAKNGGGSRTLVSTGDTFATRPITQPESPGLARRIIAYAAGPSRFVLADPRDYLLRLSMSDGDSTWTIRRTIPRKARSQEEEARLRISLQSVIDDYGTGSPAGRAAAERLDTLSREGAPHFLWPGLGFDRFERLWIVGEAGDSTFADVFGETAFIERFMLPCRKPGRRVAIRGEWILLHCEEPESIGAPYRLQLYQVVEDGNH